jgi:hypothetical protein
MKCHVCEQDAASGFLTPLGFACKACEAVSCQQWKEICDRERDLPLDDGPDEYDLEEFERFALRLAVHLLANKTFFRKLKKANPFMCSPSELSLHLKQLIINAAPDRFSTWEARGHERIFHGGTYRMIGTITKERVIEATKKAGIIA